MAEPHYDHGKRSGPPARAQEQHLEIIDAQYHEPAPRGNWTHGEQSRVDLGIEMALAHMDATGVDVALLTSTRPEFLTPALRLHPDRFVGMAEWDPDAPDIEDLLAGTRDEPGMLAVRLLAGWPPENAVRLQAGGFDNFFTLAQKHDLPVAVFASGILDAMPRAARNFPDLTLIIDHFGLKQPPFQERTHPPFLYLDRLLALAEFPNVVVKMSGGPSLSVESYPYKDVWPHLHRIIDAFGIDRLMWGTDITRVQGMVRTPAISDADYCAPEPYPGRHNYAQALHYMLDTDQLSQSEKEAILGGTMRRIFRWPRSQAPA
jgi:L-fuconolactonase